MSVRAGTFQAPRGAGDSGVVGSVSHFVTLCCCDAPFGQFIRPLGQNAGGLCEGGFFAGLNINEFHLNRVTVSVADVSHWRAPGWFHAPVLSPLCHREDDFAKRLACLRGLVFMARRVGLVRSAGHQAFIRQLVEPVGQDVGGDAQRFYQFIEPAQAEQPIPQDKDTPAVPKHGQGCRNWTFGGLIAFSARRLSAASSFFANALRRRLPNRFPHFISLATFDPQVDSAGSMIMR